MISVVTITYNNFEELAATLDSLRGVEGIESVVVNGGTCERSARLLELHAGSVIQERDRGIADAFNKGILRSTGSAVAFLNSGDLLVDREYYRIAERELMDDRQLAFVYANLEFLDDVAGAILMKPRGNVENLGRGMPFPHPTMVVRREVFDQIGLFSLDYRIAMDFDFVVRLLKQGYRGKYVPRLAVRMDGGGVSSAREAESLRECRRSLQVHGQFGIRNRWGYFERSVRLAVRRFLMAGPGRALLAGLKRLKSALG